MICSFQIKRLRSEDPLEALVLRGSKRKLGDASDAWDSLAEQPHTFRLAKTYQSRQPGETLQATSETTDPGTRKFCLPKQKRLRKNSAESSNANDETMAGLHSMVEGYMNSQKDEPPASDAEADKETEDYVYDVYFNSQTKLPKDSRIGYIDLDEDEEKLLFECSDSDEAYRAAEGDEDSNAESFYLNDYPEEDKFGSSSDDVSDTESFSKVGLHADAWSEESEDESDARYERYGW